MTALGDAERRRFDEDGFLIRRGTVSPTAIDDVTTVFARVVDRLAERWHDEGRVSSKYEELDFIHRYPRLRDEMPARFPISWRKILVSEAVHRLWQLPELAGPAEELVGAPIRAHGIWNGRPREPRNKVQSIGWHQDANYERGFDVDAPPVISVWLPLVEIRSDNAPLQYLRGSHRHGVLPFGPSPDSGNILLEIAEGDLPDGEAAILDDLMPGDAVFFGNRVVHRALPNATADEVRWSVDIRFGPDLPSQWAQDPRGYRLRSPDGAPDPEPYEVWEARHGYTATEQLAELGLGDDIDLEAVAGALGTSASDFEVF